MDPDQITWPRILGHWRLIEADMQQVYGIDLATPGLLRARSWHWLEVRILGLLSTRSRVQRVLLPEKGLDPKGTAAR